MKIPQELDSITDVVLAYHPKPKTKQAKKRLRRAKRLGLKPEKGSGENGD
jgi:hypothetical protein